MVGKVLRHVPRSRHRPDEPCPQVARIAIPNQDSANAAEPVASNRLIDKLLVTRLTWHRGGGLLYGEATIVNRNPHSVSQVIITCEMFDERGNQIGSKSTALLIPFPPGETRVSGIEFPMTVRNMQGGACRPVSASPQPDVS